MEEVNKVLPVEEAVVEPQAEFSEAPEATPESVEAVPEMEIKVDEAVEEATAPSPDNDEVV